MDAAAVRDRAAPVREDSVRSLGEGFKERVGERRRAFIFLFVFFLERIPIGFSRTPGFCGKSRPL